MKMIIDIPDADMERLRSICEKEGISLAEAVHRAITQYPACHPAIDEDAFGLWKDRDIDALDYQRSLRGEWR